MKDTLTEIKNNLQGINSRVDEAKITSAIWNLRKQNTGNQNSKKKKEPPLQMKTTSTVPVHHGDARRRRERSRN